MSLGITSHMENQLSRGVSGPVPDSVPSPKKKKKERHFKCWRSGGRFQNRKGLFLDNICKVYDASRKQNCKDGNSYCGDRFQ